MDQRERTPTDPLQPSYTVLGTAGSKFQKFWYKDDCYVCFYGLNRGAGNVFMMELPVKGTVIANWVQHV